MSVATPPEQFQGPLTAEHRQELARANQRAKKIRRAAMVAAFNGWVTAFFALCSAPFALFSIGGLLIATGLAAVAYNEFRGRKRLLNFESCGASLLGMNQLALLTLISAYCLWMLWNTFAADGHFAMQIKAQPQLAEAYDGLDELDGLVKSMMAAVYVSVIASTAIFQGINAVYYLHAGPTLIDAYVRETPGWILQLQRLEQ